MKPVVVIAFMITCVATMAVADGPAKLVGSVEAVYHEGIVTFQVNHPDAVSMAIKVYDLETDAVVYDSGPRARTLVTWPAGHDATGTFRYVVTAWNEQGEVVVSQTAATKGVDEISAIPFDTIPPNTKFLGANEIIMGGDVQVGDPTPGMRLSEDFGGSGGEILLFEEDGSTVHTWLQPDVDGEGGWFQVSGPSGGITAEGNILDEAMLTVSGTSTSSFNSGSTGDASVVLPASAVSAAEMGNEPGGAAALSGNSLSLTSGFQSILVRTLTAPSAGYVLAVASADMQMSHSNGSSTGAYCGISLSSGSVPSDGDQTLGIPSAAPSGTYNFPISMNRLFPVSAGSDTYYVTCNLFAGSITSFDRHLDLVFIPTAYGTVSTEEMESSDGDMEGAEGYISPNLPMTQAEIEAEQAESVAANLARIQAELDAIQAQADALRAMTSNEP